MNYFPDPDDATKFRLKIHPVFPDPGVCKTKPAFASYWSCLAENNFSCPYKFGFGFDYLCKHPDNFRFANDQTEKVP